MSEQIQALDYSVNLTRSILWQYNDAETLQAILNAKQAFYDRVHTQFWKFWVSDVFNLETANDFGLSVWSVILDIPLYSQTDADPSDYPAWGFGPFGINFDNGNFATDPTGISRLSIEQRRLILRLRFRQITTDCTVPEINRAIRDIFGAGSGYVLDNNDMTITYVFTPALNSTLQEALETFNALPKPSGVALTIQ